MGTNSSSAAAAASQLMGYLLISEKFCEGMKSNISSIFKKNNTHKGMIESKNREYLSFFFFWFHCFLALVAKKQP